MLARSPFLAGILILGGLQLTGLRASAQSLPDLPLPPGAVKRLGNGNQAFLCLALSPDGRLLASAGYERTIYLWDLITGQELRHWSGPERNYSCLAFSPDGRWLASGGVEYPLVQLWEVETGREVRSLAGLPRGASSVAFTSDGQMLAAGGFRTRVAYVWALPSGSLSKQLDAAALAHPDGDVGSAGWEFTHVAFGPRGTLLATGDRHERVRLWDVRAERVIREMAARGEEVVHVGFGDDGHLLASWGSKIRLWRPESGRCIRQFGEQADLRVATVAISPDGRMLASGSSGRNVGDHTVHVWEVATGYERWRLMGHRYAIASVQFTPDGLQVISGSHDRTALIWDLYAAGEETLKSEPVTNAFLEHCWRDLADSDAPQAFRAIRQLLQHPTQALAFLKSRLRPVPPAGVEEIRFLISELNSRRFADRQQATERLALQGKHCEPMLRQALAGSVSLETRHRLQELLQDCETEHYPPNLLRMLRGIEAIERIGTAEARAILRTIASGASDSRATQEAAGALARIEHRRSPTARSRLQRGASGFSTKDAASTTR